MKDDSYQILVDMHNAMEEGLRKSYNLPEHVYRDIPWVTETQFYEFIDIIGKDNIEIVAATKRTADNKSFMRGQIMISPEGMERLKEFNVKNKEKEAPQTS